MKRRTIAMIAAVAVLAGLLLAAAVMMLPGTRTATKFDRGPEPPSDAAMIAHWQKHRATLDQITEMLRRDPALNRLGLTWSDPADPERAGVAPARLADYRDLMREAGIIAISRGHRSVQFLFFTTGPTASSFGKSFVRGEASRYAEITDSDLDAAAAERPKALLQRPIGEGWWLQRDGS
jgi:hypothetical protein